MSDEFRFIPLNSEFIKTDEELLKIGGKFFSSLEKLGGIRSTAKNINDKIPLVYFIITGGTEKLFLNLLKKKKTFIKNEPIFLVAHPTHNSLPACLEILAKLQQNGLTGRIFYFNDHNDKKSLKKLIKSVKHLHVNDYLSNAKIGLIGKPSDWLIASSPSKNIVKNSWGPKVIPITMEEVTDSLENISESDLNNYFNSLSENAQSIAEPTKIDIQNNVKIYLVLKALVEKYKLDALTIRCFDLVLNIKTTGCFGLSQLNDDGYIAGCEGDLVSTVAMLWTNKLLNQIPWMANPVQLDEEQNSLWLAHCTVPRSIVKNYNLRSHFESGIGVGIQGTLENEKVTLLRIGGKRMEKIWIAEGKIIQSGNSEHLCRTQVEIKLSRGKVADLLSNPLGNHLILLKGHHSKILYNYWSLYIK